MRAHLLILAPLALAAACGGDGASTSAGGEPGGTIVMATPQRGFSSVFPAFSQDEFGRVAADNIFEQLAVIGSDLNTIGDRGFSPALASSWQWAADSMSVAFSIDPRARWHDGQPVRANDVRYSLALLKDPKIGSSLASLLADVDSMSVRDSLTAVAWYKRRSPEQFYTLVHNLWIVPEHALKDIPVEALRTSPATTKPIGSGKFRIGVVEPGVRIELVADTAHYRGRPKLDRVLISFVGDPNTALTQLLAGEADFISIVPPDALGRVDSAAVTKLVPYQGLQYSFLAFNLRDRRGQAPHPIFSDARVRRAIMLGIDRQAMLQNVFSGRGRLALGPLPAGIADTAVKMPAYDAAHAAALLDSAGWRVGANGMRSRNGRPLAFPLAVPTGSPPRMRYSVLIQEALRPLGIAVTIDQMDLGPHYMAGVQGNYDASLMGSGSDPSPSDLRQAWTLKGFPPAGQNNTRYNNPAVNALADSILAAHDVATIMQMRRRALQMIVDDAPAVWLYDVLTIAGAHERVRPEGLRADAWWSGLADWWIPADQRIDRDRIGLRAPAAASQP